MFRVGVVDDHPVARYGLEQVLAELPDVAVVCSFDSVTALEESSFAGPWADPALELVLFDLYLEEGVPAFDGLARLAMWTNVLVVSASSRASDVVSAIRAGARGYVTKHADAQMLISSVRSVAAGGFCLSPQLADIIHTELAVGAASRTDKLGGSVSVAPSLSPREEQALRYIAEGFTHAQAASRMGISKATMETYVERIRAKLQLGNKAELTRAALERFTPPPYVQPARSR